MNAGATPKPKKKKGKKEPVAKLMVNKTYLPIFPIPHYLGRMRSANEKKEDVRMIAPLKTGKAVTEFTDVTPSLPKTRIKLDRPHNPMVDNSLEIRADQRYRDMKSFPDASHKGGGHFARLMQKSKSRKFPVAEVPDDVEGEPQEAKETGFDDLAELGHEEVKTDEFARMREAPQVTDMEGRINWQHGFDRTVKRLFVDFELSDSPVCRLGHLGRMHDWFVSQGQKQVRKATEGPSYLVMDRRKDRPPGSSMCVPKLDEDTEDALEGLFTTNKSRCPGRIPRPGGLPALEH